MEAEALRLLIRSKLNDGRLPCHSMPRFWGGEGDGEQCDGCDTRITNEQLVMEGIASTHTEKKPIQFHVTCFYVWDAERRAPATRVRHTLPTEESKPPDPSSGRNSSCGPSAFYRL